MLAEHPPSLRNPSLWGLDNELYIGPPWEVLDLPPLGLLLPESLRAYRSEETVGLLADRDTPQPEQARTFLQALMQKKPQWEAWVADLPRSTWMPLSLVTEWGWGTGRRGLVEKPEQVPGLLPLFESVCGPLGGESLGWQAWPAFQAVQVFAIPQPLHQALTQDTTLGPLYNASVLWTAFWQQRIATSDAKKLHVAMLSGPRDVSIWVMEPQKLWHHGRYLVNHSHDLLFHLLRQKEKHGAKILHGPRPLTKDPEVNAALEDAFEQILPLDFQGQGQGIPNLALTRLECLQEGLRIWQAACE
ncbi:MAG: hypothetical protein EBR22_00365 [Cytophagia bacterium]|nr:hypothetical protein [Cytophagia bacterium]